jgi:DNA-directed RNA polymerase specialized sigma24 family protein
MGAEADALREHAARVRALPLAAIRLKLLTKAAKAWSLSPNAANDLVQTAMLRLVESGGVGWAHETDPHAWRYLLRAVDNARKNAAKKGIRRKTDLDTEQAEESPPSSDHGAQATLLHREEAAWAREELVRRLADSPLALKVIEACVEEGELKPAELAERLKESVKRIYKCNERIEREMTEVRAAWIARNAEGAA